MDVKDAVQVAKDYARQLFADEGVINLGLEEVEFDEQAGIWSVTVGFSRPWDKPSGALATLAQRLSIPGRSYKVVRILDASGNVISVKNRESKP